MSQTYWASAEPAGDGVTLLKVGFGRRAPNSEVVPAAIAAVEALDLAGGRGLKIDGPASLPIAAALAHLVAHKYGFVAWYDPKLEGYVVAISHDPAYRPGDLLE